MTDFAQPSSPDVTVALLTCNAGPLLARLLTAVKDQASAKIVEIVAIDSGSTDETLTILKRFSVRTKTIAPSEFNFGRTRDLIFEEAQAPIVISLSQDAIPATPEWLNNLTRPLDDPGVAAACGRSVPDPDRGYPQFPWERNGYFYFTREMKVFAARYGRGLSNANSAIRRSVWASLRFGKASIGEDYRFQSKLSETPWRIAFPDGATVLHHHHYTVASLYKRCRNEGLGLRELGCPYSEMDLALDLFSPRRCLAWGRELLHGRLTEMADLVFPVLRPVAVYMGSRFGKEYLR